MAAAEVAVILLVDIAPGSRLWGWSRFVVARFGLRQVPGLRFFKVLGSGHEGGFGLRPSGSSGAFAASLGIRRKAPRPSTVPNPFAKKSRRFID